MPALPLHTAGKYVAAAYVVLFALVLIYVAIMAMRLSRIEREVGELLALSRLNEDREEDSPQGKNRAEGSAQEQDREEGSPQQEPEPAGVEGAHA